MVNMGTKSQSRLYMDKYKTQINWSSVLLKATVAASTLIKASSLSSSAYCSNGQLRPKSISGGGSSSIINTHSLSWNKPLHVPTKSAVKPLLMSTNNGKNSDKSERFRITYDQFDFDETFSFNMFQNELDSTKSDLPTVTDAYRNLETRQNDRPWFLTTAHIKELRVPELRKACLERDLSKAGKKEELQNRLIEWSTNEEARKSTLEKAGIVDYRVLPLQSARLKRNPGKNRMDRLSNLLASLEKDPTKLPKATDDEEDEDDDLFELTNSTSADEYLGLLTKTYHSSPHTPYSNLQLTQMYNDAKKADIKGDIKTAKRILVQLSKITPHDGRVVRRLARLHSSRGDYDSARKTLQNACRNYPENSHLWNGLAQIELKTNRPGLARQYFAEAISANPEFPNAYHALGRLEHQDGNIREALSILKKGIRYCPTNHRLHHALGSLYLEAKMLVPAEESLKKGMKCGPNWSQSFFCTSLAHAAYEMEGVQKAAEWLRKGVSLNPMHAQGWASLGELEESEDNFDAARKVYADAVEKYEEVRLKKGKTLRMGDKWRNVYMNWASMEERLGNISQAGEIYLKAAKVFPKDWNILTTFALTMVKSQGGLSHAGIKSIFGRACDIVGSRHANPYRMYANYESTLSNHHRARSIFYLGSETVSKSLMKGEENHGLSALFYDWGKFENEHMNNPKQARLLFDEALNLAGNACGELRSKILFCIGDLEYKNKHLYTAKHYVCLSINESEINGSKSAWTLWANICNELGQKSVEDICIAQAEIQGKKEMNLWMDDDSLLPSNLLKDPNLKQMLGKTPWNRKLAYNTLKDRSLVSPIA